MPTNFLSLPRELHDNVYEQLLVLERNVSQPWFNYFHFNELTLGFLCANKTIHLEACLILYGKNRFDFTIGNAEDISGFLNQIGRNNASYLLHLIIDFPRFSNLDLQASVVRLNDDSYRILTKI